MDVKKPSKPYLYHALPRPGKIEVVPTKPVVTQEDLSLAYTPGVAEVCTAIQEDPSKASELTSKSNLVAVITNGSAVLGLGNIGPLASKPVMEGKSVLFKKFANIDAFDIELDEADPDAFVETVARMAPTFGGINLEDIKAPECFEIERKLKDRLSIPVMHDDQHGTAIIATAAFINALHVTGKDKKKVKVVCSGAGAAGLSCMRMLASYGVPVKNITLVDIHGVVYAGRENITSHMQEFAHKTKARTLKDALKGADCFFGLSAGGILKPEMLKDMAKQPIVFAMANPTPEIMPDLAKQARPDAIVGTGRSDFPNQINNVLGFPFLFRGALDVGATTINAEMKLAASEALAELARKAADEELSKAYKGVKLKFGEDYIIPKPFDPRLLHTIAPAVAKAAMESGVATRPIEDLEGYAVSLQGSVDKSFSIMRRIFNQARKDPKRIVFPEGEELKIIRATQRIVEEGIAHPILLGREDIIRERIIEAGVDMKEGEDFTLIDPNNCNGSLEKYAEGYYQKRKRDGIMRQEAEIAVRSRWAAFGAMMVELGDADSMVVGVTGKFSKFLRAVNILDKKPGVSGVYALQLIMHKDNVYFMADTHVNPNPTAEQIAEMASLAADEIRHFGIEPRMALLSHSNFGSSKQDGSRKMSKAYKLIKQQRPDIMVEGEMQADAALSPDILKTIFPENGLDGKPANVLLMPDVDSANIAFNLLRVVLSRGEYIGPILLGMDKPVHILSVEAPVRRIVNMAALAVVEAQGK